MTILFPDRWGGFTLTFTFLLFAGDGKQRAKHVSVMTIYYTIFPCLLFINGDLFRSRQSRATARPRPHSGRLEYYKGANGKHILWFIHIRPFFFNLKNNFLLFVSLWALVINSGTDGSVETHTRDCFITLLHAAFVPQQRHLQCTADGHK